MITFQQLVLPCVPHAWSVLLHTVQTFSLCSQTISRLQKFLDHRKIDLLDVLPRSRSGVIQLDNLPLESNAALASIAALKASLRPDSISAVELVDLASVPVLLLEFEDTIVKIGEAIVKRWARSSSRVCLGELQLAGKLTDRVISLRHVDLLSAGHSGVQRDGTSAVEVREDGLVGVDTGAVGSRVLWAVGGGVLSDVKFESVCCERAQVDGCTSGQC